MIRTSSLSILTFFFMTLPLSVGAATLYLDPSTATYGPGDTFVVNVRLNTDTNQCINAAQVEIDYPKDTLRAVDFGRGSSIFSLWISDPQIDTATGKISFAGGIPGGYCGRIPGDPALSNIVGKIVFTVISANAPSASIHIAPLTTLYANDGLGTKVTPSLQDATISIVPTARSETNPWLAEVSADTIPPDSFDVQVESTRGVFGGKYYIVFSTVDKQSGLDHFELFERGVWKHVTSPYELQDQFLKGGIQVRAIDKAGNVRLGNYTEGSAPPRQYSLTDFLLPMVAFGILIIALCVRIYLRYRKTSGEIVDLRA